MLKGLGALTGQGIQELGMGAIFSSWKQCDKSSIFLWGGNEILQKLGVFISSLEKEDIPF